MAQTYSTDQVMKHLKSLITADKKRNAVAAELGVTAQFLCDVLYGRRAITDRLAKALGYERMPDRFRKVTIDAEERTGVQR